MSEKRNLPLIIAPAVTLIILGAFFALYRIFPFGSNTVSWCDMNQQTVPLLMDLKDILDGRSGLFYSTGNAGGMNFWGVFLFFIASPLYLSVKFVAKSEIIYLVNILFAVKLGLCSLTAAIYMKYIHKSLKPSYSVILCVMYALCGYGIMYCQTLVWLDIMALFPLLVLSIEKMCRQNKPVMYCIILCLMVAVNFYLSYMNVIYIAISVPLFLRIRCSVAERKKASVSFIWSSIAAMLITAPVWLCSFLQTTASARGGSTLYGLMYKPLFENGANKFTVVMSTALCIAVLPFFIKNKISRRKDIRYNIILLVLLLIPVFIDPVNKMWHTGSYQCFPLRYGYGVVFTMITLAARYFEREQSGGRSSKGFAAVMTVLAAAFILVSVYVVDSRKSVLSSYIDTLRLDRNAFKLLFSLFIFACLIYVISIMLHRKGLIGRKLLCFIFSGLFIGEVFTSFSVNIGYAANDGGILKSCAPLEYDSSGKSYYRTRTEKKYLHVNMLGGLGYNSLAHYTSLTSEDYMYAMKKLGYSSYWMEVGSNCGTILTDALMSIKYSIGAYYDFKSYYDITGLEGDLERGESSICCPMGIVNSLSPEQMKTLGDGSRVDIQRSLARKFFGRDDMIHEYKPSFTANGIFEYKNSRYCIDASEPDMSLCQVRYTINVKGRQILYFDIFDRLSNDLSEIYYGAAKVYVNGNCLTSDYPNQKNNGIMTLGEFCDTTAEILIVLKKNISVKSFGVFGIDTELLKNCTDSINGCDLYRERSGIYGECYAGEDDWLYMSVPYDPGLKVRVNGKNTEPVKVNDSFCAVRLEKGKNSISLSFIPEGMPVGVTLTFLGFAMCIVRWVYRRRKMSVSVAAEKISVKLCVLLFIAVMAVIYILPVIIKLAAVVSAAV